MIEKRNKQKPFLLYVAWNAPHTPLQAPEKYLEQYAHIDDEVRRIYSAMVTQINDSVAALVDALETEGLRRDTLTIWLSDNGGLVTGGADNSPLSDGKGNPYEEPSGLSAGSRAATSSATSTTFTSSRPAWLAASLSMIGQ